jgi:hypothetical protein
VSLGTAEGVSICSSKTSNTDCSGLLACESVLTGRWEDGIDSGGLVQVFFIQLAVSVDDLITAVGTTLATLLSSVTLSSSLSCFACSAPVMYAEETTTVVIRVSST